MESPLKQATQAERERCIRIAQDEWRKALRGEVQWGTAMANVITRIETVAPMPPNELPQLELRFYMRGVDPLRGRYILQQRYHHKSGVTEWEDVPSVEQDG